MHLAHAYVGVDRIERLALGVLHLIDHIVEEGRLGAPQFGVFQRHHYRHALHGRGLGTRHRLAAVLHHDRQRIAAGDVVICRYDDYMLLVNIGNHLHALQCHGVHSLHPYRLPDARGTGIAATHRIIVRRLLAAGLRTAAQVALGMHHKAVHAAVTHKVGHIERERVRAAVMTAHELAVDIYLRLVIHGAEIEFHALALPLRRYLDLALIPYAVDEIGIAHTRKFAFGSKRHGNTAVEALTVIKIAVTARIRQVERKTPLAVKVDPVGSFELRAGILRTRLRAYCH